MERYTNTILNKQGKPVAGAVVTVTTYPGNEPAIIYAADGGQAVESVSSDENGRFAFYAADGHYNLSIVGKHIDPFTMTDIVLNDPDDEASLAALNGAVARVASLEADATAISVRRYIAGPVDGVTSNQNGIVAAVAAAYSAGVPLAWPAGTYVSTASIPNFHNVRHIGPGVIKRGTTTYAVQPKGKSTKTNVLYVSKAGMAANDGLSSDSPMLAIQLAFDALTNAGQALAGNWHISVAAGAYNEFATLSGIAFKNRLKIYGPEVSGGVPSVIIDGAGLTAQSLNGMLLSDGIFAVVKDIKFTNWNGGSGVGPSDASTGLNVSGNCNVWADNVHADLCGSAIAATRSRIYQGRGIVSNCDTGSTAFANTTCSYGYGGATTYSGCAQAINIRDGSAGVVDGGVLTNNAIGIKVTNQSHTRVSNCAFTNSGTADVYLYTGSSCFFGAGNSHTVGKKLRGEFALDLDNASQIFFNADTKRFNFGELGTPGYQFHFRNSITGSFASSAAMMALEADSPQLALNGGSSGTFGLLCAIPSKSSAASLLYTAADGNWRLRANDVDSYRFASNTFRPVSDNAVSLGLPASRFSVVNAYNVNLKPPASVTPTNNGELVFELPSDTQVRIKVKGGDGVVRSTTLTLT